MPPSAFPPWEGFTSVGGGQLGCVDPECEVWNLEPAVGLSRNETVSGKAEMDQNRDEWEATAERSQPLRKTEVRVHVRP